MALKNLFDMVKADRYTADGREALIKAQEAETEDKVYQIGEISQKTGLQKTANGWVKPKNGKQPGAKKEDYKPSRRVDPKKQPQVSNPNVLGMTSSGAKKRFEALGGEFLENKDGVDIFKTRDGDLVKVHYDDNKKVLRTETTPAESKPAPKSLAGTPMKKADLNSKDPYEITHSMKPDTASEAKEMDKISAFMQEETGATLRNAITARESFYKNTKNPTPEQQEGLAALMKIQQKLGYGKPAEGPALNGQKKTVSHQEYRDGPMYRPAGSKPAAPVKRNEAETVKHSDGKESYRIKGTQFYFKTPEEAESAIMAESRYGKTYATPSKDPEINNIQEALGFKLDMLGSGKSMDEFIKKTGENEYAANVWGFGTNSKGTLINKLSETDSPNATIKKENGEWKLHYKDRDGKETVVTATGRKDPTRDAAPRVLTGDTRIRVRKA